MRAGSIITSLVALLVGFAAALPNPISYPSSNDQVQAGSTITIRWNPTTGGTVTLVLRSGASTNLAEGTLIVSQAENSGSYSWSIDNMITRGSQYTIQIISDQDTEMVNYSPFFVIDSDYTVPTSTSTVSIGVPTAVPEAPTSAGAGAGATAISVPLYPGAVQPSTAPMAGAVPTQMLPSASVPPPAITPPAAAGATSTGGVAPRQTGGAMAALAAVGMVAYAL